MDYSGYPCPPYKIIILDEADSMTEDAQVYCYTHDRSICNSSYLIHMVSLWYLYTSVECFEAYYGDLLQSDQILLYMQLYQQVFHLLDLIMLLWYKYCILKSMIVNVCYRIIEPLASRCAKFRFKPLSEDVMSSRITHICNAEGLNLDAQVLFELDSLVMRQMVFICFMHYYNNIKSITSNIQLFNEFLMLRCL